MDKEYLLNGYFENSLTEDEKIAFQNLLESDATFLEEFNFRKNLKTAITRNNRSELKEKLKQHENKTNKPIFQLNWKYAAAVVLILSFGTYFLVNDFQNQESLYAVYYETYPNTISPVVRAEPTDGTLEERAFQAYENKKYKEAVILFSELYDSIQKEYAVFYKAISLIEIDDDMQAIETLKLTDWSEEYKAKSLWYLAMVYLKQDNKSQAKITLEELMNQGNYRQEEVKELLGKL